jgi:uncharacterized protein
MWTRAAWWLAVGLLAAFVVTPANAQFIFKSGFDCTKAASVVERTICGNMYLSQFDSALAEAYARATASGGAAAEPVAREHQLWLKQRDDECAKLPQGPGAPYLNPAIARCLGNAYERRLVELGPEFAPPTPGTTSPIEGIARIDWVKASYPVKTSKSAVAFAEYDATGNAMRVVAVDFAKRTVDFTGGFTEGRLVSIDDEFVMVQEGRQATLYRRGTTTKLGEFEVFATSAMIENKRILFYRAGAWDKVPAAIDVFDRATAQKISSHELGYGPELVVVFWDGKVIVLRNGGIDLYSADMQLVKTAPAPSGQRRQYEPCGPSDVRLFDHRLVYTVDCGQIVVFDLDRFEIAPPLQRIEGVSTGAILDNHLFAAAGTTGPDRGAIYDLRTNQQAWGFPVTGQLFPAGDLLVVWTGGWPYGPMRLVKIDLTRLGSRAAELDAITRAHAQANAVLTGGGSADDAVIQMERSAIGPLARQVERTAAEREQVIDYAAWLAGGIDRQKEGVELLSGLAARDPDDAALQRRLAGAHLRTFLLNGESWALNRGRTLLERQGRWTPELEARLAVPAIPFTRAPLESGTGFGELLYVFGDKIVVGGYRDGGPGIAVYDRRTFALDWAIQLKPGDNSLEDHVTSITPMTDGKVAVWIGYRFSKQKDRTDVAVVDLAARTVELRALDVQPLQAVATPEGTIVCTQVARQLIGCELRDSRTLLPLPRPVDGALMAVLGRSGVDPAVLVDKVLARPPHAVQGYPLSVGERGVFALETQPGTHSVVFRPFADPENAWRLAPAGETWPGSIWPIEGTDTALIATREAGRTVVAEARLAERSISRRFALAQEDTDRLDGQRWNNFFLFSLNSDIYLYDLRARGLAGVLHNVTPVRIERMMVAGDQLLVLASDSKVSTVISLADLDRYARAAVSAFAAVDELLLH